MVKEFFKPNWKKIVLMVVLLLFTGVMGIMMMSVGLPNTIIPIIILLGFPLFITFMFGPVGFIIGLVLNILWLYLVSCLLMKLFKFIKSKLLLINWNVKKFIILGIIVIIGFLIFCFFTFGWSDVLVATADDSGATTQGVNDIASANNQFAIDLYAKINNNANENIFFSPWSISTAVAMLYEGARGDTANEIQNVFHFPSDDTSRRNSYAKMLNTLNKASGKYKLSMANAIWLQEDYPFLKEYKDTISTYYLGEVKNLDFVHNPSGASSDINNWVSKNTNNKITNIVSPNMFNEYSRAVLTNAIYFKGKWEHQFDKHDTRAEEFTLESGSTIQVQMMRLTDDELDFNYVESDGIQVLEMPYQGDKISMLVLLPRTDISDSMFDMGKDQQQISNMTHLESILSEEKLREWRSMMKPQTVFIYLPKYTFETSYSLSEYLKDMGMNLPFIWPGADFSGMDGTKLLYVDKVLHKAYIDVYEEGTEAAAVTVSLGVGMGMPYYIEFRADHPFIFIIQETETGNILFMGKVNNPTQK